jgi:hypothetical protein
MPGRFAGRGWDATRTPEGKRNGTILNGAAMTAAAGCPEVEDNVSIGPLSATCLRPSSSPKPQRHYAHGYL